jgi:uncharacterized protein (TIGR03435 family)
MRRVVVAAVVAGCVWAQEPKRFDVATVKAYTVNDGNFMLRPLPGGKLTAVGVTLKMLMMFAYNVKAFQISGAPGWVGSDLWEIQAQAEAVDRLAIDDSRAALRALIGERYGLRVHRETRKMPVYALAALKPAGSKLGPPTGPPPAGICPCGPASLAPKRATMSNLANQLSTILWRTVIDKTGLKGEYAFMLEWTPAPGEYGPEALGLPPGTPSDPPPNAVYKGPAIFTAIREQLGLRLESQRGPVEVVVIDRVERPVEN